MMPRLPINGGFYTCPYRVAETSGIKPATLGKWLRRQMTSYGYSLTVAVHQKRPLLEETDATVIRAVQEAFPLGVGLISRRKQKEMRQYAEQIRAVLKPSP